MNTGSTTPSANGGQRYSITWEPRGVVRRFHGELTGKLALESLDRTLGDERYDDVRFSLADLCEVSHYDITEDEIDGLAARYYGASMSNRRVITAVVAHQPQVVALVERVRALGLAPMTIELFSSEAAARDWIARELQQRGW